MKKGDAKLLYTGSEHDFNSKALWERCKDHKQTLSIIKTDLDTVIGVYNPDEFVDTTGK